MKDDFNFIRDPKSNGSRAEEENSLYLGINSDEPPPSFSTSSQVVHPKTSINSTRNPYQSTLDTTTKDKPYFVGPEEEETNQYSGRNYELKEPEI